ncbi:extracellular solute-binding protein [Dongia sp.]|uniref:extracellular solute-binding protein n=1 Tax=Dongia sp. TaxID=1977262 RepID=UPI0037520783
MSHRALIVALIVPLAVLMAAFQNPVLAQEKLVKLYAWNGYLSPTVLESFSRASGTKTQVETYETPDEAAAKLAGGNAGYDIVVLKAVPQLSQAIQAGKFQPLDAARLPALAGQDPALTKLLAGADVPTASTGIYLWGTIGLALRTDLIRKRAEDAPLNSYALIFDVRFAKKLQGCGIGLIDDPMVVLPMALRYLGLDPNQADEPEWERAAAVVQKIRPYVRTLDSANLVSGLTGKKLCLATEWNGDAVQAANKLKASEPAPKAGQVAAVIDYVVPREGGLAFIDAFAIPKDAPHPDAAYAFLNHLLQPKMIATTAGEMGYANGQPGSYDQVYAPLAADPRIFPTDAVKAKLVLVKPLAPDLQLRVDQLWAQIKAGGP